MTEEEDGARSSEICQEEAGEVRGPFEEAQCGRGVIDHVRPLVGIVLSGFVLAILAVLGTASPCLACPPSGGPSEMLVLRLESVQRGDQLPDSVPVYDSDVISLEGVGNQFFMIVKAGGTTVIAEFQK